MESNDYQNVAVWPVAFVAEGMRAALSLREVGVVAAAGGSRAAEDLEGAERVHKVAELVSAVEEDPVVGKAEEAANKSLCFEAGTDGKAAMEREERPLQEAEDSVGVERVGVASAMIDVRHSHS